jgi:cytochrome c oxidase subunit 2
MNPTTAPAHALLAKGPQASVIADLFWFYGIIMAVICILIWTFVLIALFRRRAGQDVANTPRLDEQSIRETRPTEPVAALSAAGERRRLRWVAGATGVSVMILFTLLYRSVAAGSQLTDKVPEGALRVEITGHRWWWAIRYVDDDPSKIITTANELHIPVGRPIQLILTSADVIHSFWVPNLHGKRDLVPGRSSTLVLQANQPGSYRGQCAEFCGHAHAQMALLVKAESSAQFAAWSLAQRADAHAPRTAAEQRGQQVFLTSPCVLCHTVSGTSAQGSTGPDLSHVASRSTLAAAMLENNRGNLAGWIVNAQHLKPGTAMPDISLPAEDLHALIAYLENLR